MRLTRVGVTPLKGARHEALDAVGLAADGPVDDRTFCLVEPRRRRVVRTVDNPSMMAVRARLSAGVLTTLVGPAEVTGVPEPTEEVLDCDYWGRRVPLQVQRSGHAALLAEHLGHEVVLARAPVPGTVVYGAPVTLVTTSAVEELAARSGATAIDPARFRPTVVVDDRARPLEQAPAGTRLRLGEAVVELAGEVPRCAVVDHDPLTGRKDPGLLQALARYRRAAGVVSFGRYARVVAPGRARPGDVVES
jgi:uncharacterized protein YcbX